MIGIVCVNAFICAFSDELQVKQFSGNGLPKIAYEITIRGEFQIEAFISLSQLISGVNKMPHFARQHII